MVSKVLRVYPASGHTTVAGKIVTVPQIRLQGKWVEKLGFTVGSKFTLVADNGTIVLQSLRGISE